MHEPKTGKGRATRDRILDAAAELMRTQGIAGTSLDKILGLSKTGKSQFYHYFQDRSAFLRALLQHQLGAMAAALGSHTENLGRWAGIEAWLESICIWNESRESIGGCPLGVLAMEEAPRDDELRGELAKVFVQWHAPLRDGLDRLQERGELRAEAPTSELAEFVCTAVQGGFLLSRTYRDPGPLRRACDHVLRYLNSYALTRVLD